MNEIGVRHSEFPASDSRAQCTREGQSMTMWMSMLEGTSLPGLLPPLDGVTCEIALLSLTAGIVRGFAGFGGGMVLIPFISAIFGPRMGATSILVADGLLTIPYLWASIRRCESRTVLPVATGAILALPLGAYLLQTVDPTPIRWSLAPIILVLLAITLSGWRYHDTPKAGISLLVGAASGFLSGLIQLSGPPVVALWISGPASPGTIRANIFVFFGIITVVAVVSYTVGHIFSWALLPVLVPMIPCYGIGLLLGGRFFGRANPVLFRRIAVALIGLSVIVSLPIFDSYLR
jgi:uncharacterized membrane protein YfcA